MGHRPAARRAQPPHPQPGPAHQQPAPSQPGQGYQPGQAVPRTRLPAQPGYQQPSPYQQGHATPGYQPGHTGRQAYAGQPGQPGQQAYAGQQGYAAQPYGGYVQPEPTAVHGYNPCALEPQPGPYGYGTDDEWDEVPASGGFKLRLMLLPALLTVVAMVLAITQTLIDVTAGSATVAGTWKINDFGTNLTIGVLIGAGAALLGALLACFGQRWAAGLAGGAGLSLAGIVVIPLALIDVLSDTVEGSGTLERSLGYWALVATGGLGVLTFLLSLTRSGDDGRAGLDPWVAALGALATVAAVAGPFIPMNGARLDENWDTLPTLFLVARFAHLGLLLLTGVIGFLLVRRYGLGLAIGGALGVGWLLVSSQFDLTDRPPLGSGGIAQASPAPLPPGIFNPGDLEGRPHIVTIAGMALIGFFALVATVMALIDRDGALQTPNVDDTAGTWAVGYARRIRRPKFSTRARARCQRTGEGRTPPIQSTARAGGAADAPTGSTHSPASAPRVSTRASRTRHITERVGLPATGTNVSDLADDGQRTDGRRQRSGSALPQL